MKAKYASGSYLMIFFNHYGKKIDSCTHEGCYSSAMESADLEMAKNKDLYDSYVVARIVHNSKEKSRWE